jgi:steroid delta-isomerase-like uncharacterized protein
MLQPLDPFAKAPVDAAQAPGAVRRRERCEDEGDFAASGYVEEIGTGRRATPKESTENAREWKAAFPNSTGKVTNRIVEGNKGAAEIIWRGTNTGPLMGQPPTGKAVTVRAVLAIDTDGGKITRASHYIDLAGMMSQLGAK